MFNFNGLIISEQFCDVGGLLVVLCFHRLTHVDIKNLEKIQFYYKSQILYIDFIMYERI